MGDIRNTLNKIQGRIDDHAALEGWLHAHGWRQGVGYETKYVECRRCKRDQYRTHGLRIPGSTWVRIDGLCEPCRDELHAKRERDEAAGLTALTARRSWGKLTEPPK